MGLGGDTGGRLVAEWLVAVVTALVALSFFLPITFEWKVFAILVLVVEGALLIMGQLGTGRRVARPIRSWLRDRRIRRYPEIVADFHRLEQRIHRVL